MHDIILLSEIKCNFMFNPSRTKPFLPTHNTKGGGEFHPTHGSHISERDTATLSNLPFSTLQMRKIATKNRFPSYIPSA